MHIASISFGKDSLATVLLAIQHHEPLDRCVFAEVMYDHQRGISGEIPEHIEWIYGTAIPKLKNMGVKIDVVRSDIDYLYYFRTRVRGVNSRVNSTASPSVASVSSIESASCAQSVSTTRLSFLQPLFLTHLRQVSPPPFLTLLRQPPSPLNSQL